MKRRLLFWIMGLLTSPVWAQSPSPDLRGIYIYTNGLAQQMAPDIPALSASFSIPGVDGVAIVVGWGDVEPAMGKYDWTVPDKWIGQVIALGKKIDLVVPAGSYTPAWLFQPPPAGAGATELSFTVSPHDGETGFCESTTIAPPWDPAFLAQWDAMLAALSAHLKSAGTYSAITLVRLTGINRSSGSEELRLPQETAQSSGLACVTDAITTWQQAGYRPSLLLQGWNSIIGSFEKSFPGKPFAVSVIDPPNAFPPIDENGAVIKGTPPDATQPLLLSASQMFPGRLVVQLDFLIPGQVPSTEVTNAAQNLGTLAAFQTNEYLGDSGAACAGPNTDPTPCTDATFLTLLETGIYPLGQSNPLRSQYIEVFHDNAAAFPDDILKAHFELVPPAISLVANAESEAPTIAPNTWVEIKGSGLSLIGDSRIWMTSDFVKNQLPTQLDSITATVNGKSAFLYYISPTQINILTPPDAMSGPVQVQVTNNGTTTATFTAQAQPLSPSFFVFDATHVVGVHLNGGDIGPTTLYPGLTTPAKPGEIVVLYANGFGQTSTPVVSGAVSQSGNLSPLPAIKIGGITAAVQFAGLVSPGLFQFNVVVPSSTADGDQPITATYNGVTTQAGTVISIQQ